MNLQKANARAVDFIAKTGKTQQLRDHICQTVTALLRGRIVFIQTIVLTSHQEPRRVTAMTLWSTENGATQRPWEKISQVCEIFSPLIDIVLKVRTCKVDLMKAKEAETQLIVTASSSLSGGGDLEVGTSAHH